MVEQDARAGPAGKLRGMKTTDALPGRWAEVELRHPAGYLRIDGPVRETWEGPAPDGPADGVGLLIHSAAGLGGASVILPQARVPSLLAGEPVDLGGARLRLRLRPETRAPDTPPPDP